MNEVVREFLLETNENLAQLDLDLVTLEKEPSEKETLARVFRTLHTVKGTAGFLGLPNLQAVAHAGENLLSRLRAGEQAFNAEIASALLAVVDAIRRILTSFETTTIEGDADFNPLIQTLERLTNAKPTVRKSAPILAPPPAAPEPAKPSVVQTLPQQQEAVKPAVSQYASSLPNPSFISSPSVISSNRPSGEPPEPRAPAVSDSAIRVDVGLLDKLMNLVGELVLARNQLMQFSASQEDGAFLGPVQRLNLLTTELQTGVMKTRLQPIGNVWGKFPRVVRDLAIACGKQVRLEMDGQETELDRTIIEAIRDPLTHLVRNAVDHGIEAPAERVARGKPAEGSLTLHAFHEGGKVIIELTDDGVGIDPQRIREKALQAKVVTPSQVIRLTERELVNLIFQPGFSTAEKVTQFSGRGVGMDVVRTNIEKIGGTVDLETKLGRGTTVRMKIPLTLAIIPALSVASGGDRYAIPQVSLLELVRLEGEQIQHGIEQIQNAPVYRLRGNLLPLVYLNQVLQVQSRSNPGEINIVVLQADDRQFGLVVDAIHDTEEIVVKPLQKQLKGLAVYSGATIMGDGKVALILDVLGLAQKAHVVSATRERSLSEKLTTVTAGDRHSVLLFSSPEGSRMAIPISLVARLEMFPRSALERVGTMDMVQYRGEILPLLFVGQVLKRRGSTRNSGNSRNGHRRRVVAETNKDEPVPVVVYASGGRCVGLVVGSILDIVEETITVRSQPTRAGVLFNAVIQERVTEFLDVEGILRAAGLASFEKAQAQSMET